MNKKLMYIALTFVIVVGGLVLGVLFLKKSPVATMNVPEIQAINSFVGRAGIPEISGWKSYPDCGDAGGLKSAGNKLEVNDIPINQQQAAKLRSLADEQGYTVSARNDGFELRKDTSTLIILDRGRPENKAGLFISITYKTLPSGFPKGDQTCM